MRRIGLAPLSEVIADIDLSIGPTPAKIEAERRAEGCYTALLGFGQGDGTFVQRWWSFAGSPDARIVVPSLGARPCAIEQAVRCALE